MWNPGSRPWFFLAKRTEHKLAIEVEIYLMWYLIACIDFLLCPHPSHTQHMFRWTVRTCFLQLLLSWEIKDDRISGQLFSLTNLHYTPYYRSDTCGTHHVTLLGPLWKILAVYSNCGSYAYYYYPQFYALCFCSPQNPPCYCSEPPHCYRSSPLSASAKGSHSVTVQCSLCAQRHTSCHQPVVVFNLANNCSPTVDWVTERDGVGVEGGG